MPRFSTEEGHLVIELDRLAQAPHVQEAIEWFNTQWDREATEGRRASAAVPTEAETRAARKATRVMGAFFETAAVLVRNGILSEELFFDRWMVEPYWNTSKPYILAGRKSTGSDAIAENFEWLARREAAAYARIAASRAA